MSKRVTVHYRRLIDRNLANLDFAANFDAGLDGQINGVRLRDEDAVRITTSSDDHRMCLLSPAINANFCFGEIAVFKEGDVLAIMAGSALPGMALTAAAPRPFSESVVEASNLGKQLEGQVRFWFGYIVTGGTAALAVLMARAFSWRLDTPRWAETPAFVPDGSGWLVFVVVSASVFTIIRIRHVLTAVVDLVRLATRADISAVRERQRAVQRAVLEQITNEDVNGERGAVLPPRERL